MPDEFRAIRKYHPEIYGDDNWLIAKCIDGYIGAVRESCTSMTPE
jgi:hypothetical protein